ncbi:hypothetical protein PG985_012433 [Apiospora marii]|uniref:uncharacterized protein n=1 Tax=Apiospora marii TaxID=335849 RepID=UPI0031314B01
MHFTTCSLATSTSLPAHSGRRSRFEHGERKPKRFFTVEVLAGSKTWEKAFQLPLKEAQEKHYTVLYELESETNSEFEFQAHLVLFLAMYGVTKLPEDQYCFATAAGPDYIIDRLSVIITRYFNRLVTWKSIPNFLTRGDIDKLYLLEINETYIAYKDSNIRGKKFPERATKSGSAGRVAPRHLLKINGR